MNKKLLFAAATAACMSLSGTASAVTASGTLSINGNDGFTSTAIFFEAGQTSNVGGGTGNFAGVLPCNDCVTMIPTLQTTTVLPALIYTAISGLTSTFTLNPPASFVFTPGVPGSTLDQLVISGTGIATLTGFDPTPAFWTL